ncbi:hypothetical protein ACFV1D_06815, partial [Streptomyces mirabilis]
AGRPAPAPPTAAAAPPPLRPPPPGPKTSLATEQLVGNVKGSVDLSKTFTNDFAIQANKTEGFKTTTTPAGPNG